MPTLTESIRTLFNIPDSTRVTAPHAPAPTIDSAVPLAGEITLLTGPSGGGKSTFLAQLCECIRCNGSLVNLSDIAPPPRAVIDAFDARTSIERRLEILARVGLAEALDYLRAPAALSEGQRFRLRLALALEQAINESAEKHSPCTIVCDEFASSLDDITAAVVCRCLRRIVDAQHANLSAVVATGRSGLRVAMEPDRIVVCDFGRWGTL